MLFDDEEFFQVDNSPKDDTQITTTILYFSEDELKNFKAGCKQRMKELYGSEAANKGNLSDLLLYLVSNPITPPDEKNSSQTIPN